MAEPAHPTLLIVPGPPPTMEDQRLLDLPPAAYVVTKASPDVWLVRVVETGREIYRGPGPAVVVVSPAPF